MTQSENSDLPFLVNFSSTPMSQLVTYTVDYALIVDYALKGREGGRGYHWLYHRPNTTTGVNKQLACIHVVLSLVHT